jgi:hypothetical protein
MNATNICVAISGRFATDQPMNIGFCTSAAFSLFLRREGQSTKLIAESISIVLYQCVCPFACLRFVSLETLKNCFLQFLCFDPGTAIVVSDSFGMLRRKKT